MRPKIRESIRVRLVQADRVGAARAVKMLRRPGHSPSIDVDWSANLESAIDALGKEDADVVLLDLTLPDSAGPQAVKRMRTAAFWVPIVALSDAWDEDTAQESLRAGAQDFLLKSDLDHPTLLVRALHNAIVCQRMRRENERLIEHLRKAERMASLGAVVGGLSFAFNTLFGNVLEHIDAAVERLGAMDDAAAAPQRDLIAIRREVMRGCQMTDQLRDFCGTRASIPSHPIDLSGFVSEVARTLDTMVGGSARICYELEAPGPRVVANRLQLYQILVALVANGMEAIEGDDGEVRVAAGRIDADRELLGRTLGLHGAEPGTYAFLEVSDSGRGMDGATRERIFDPFFTTKLAGRGLGLAAVFGIAHQLGAGLLVNSAPGRGTTICLLMSAYERLDA